MRTKRALASVIFSALFLDSFAALVFTGSSDPVVTVTPSASTGLEAVYVVRDARGVTVSHDSGRAVKWSKFSSSGAAYAEEIGTSVSINLSDADGGYIAETGGRAYYFWIVNYANHPLSLNSVNPAEAQSDCLRTDLELNGSGERIVYYTINGRSEELDREIEISYTTLAYDADATAYVQHDAVHAIAYVRPTVSVEAPLCDTRFTVSGDKFLKAWGAEISVESPTLTAYHIEAQTSATQEKREVDNEQRDDAAELGGSAPCEITFKADVTDAAAFYEWQLSRNSEFDPIDDRYPQTELNYTFSDQGTFYIRFFAADAAGTCEFTGDVYTVSTGASDIQCPNAFTPESSPGVNDEWKVSYKSITSFECHIFNRWGTEMFSFTDPSAGWDGKYKGKYVPAGVYYYVIKAHGADGREYKLSGDINIIKSKDLHTTDSSEE